MRTLRTSPNASRRNGFIYLAVLFTSLIIMTAVAGALAMSTSNLRAENDRLSRQSALRLAENELHRIASGMRTSSLWRDNSTNNAFTNWYGTMVDGVSVNEGTVRHRFVDVDGNLADDLSDAVDLTVHAAVGRAEAAIVATLESDPNPFQILHYSVTASDDIRVEDGGTIAAEGSIQVHDDCKTNSWGIITAPRLECAGNIESYVYLRGDRATSAVSMPTSDIVSEYISKGTRIPRGALGWSGGDRAIRDVVLSKTVNPYGSVDPNGIYWINAGGFDIRIQNSRIEATLAIYNAADIEIRGGIVWRHPGAADAILVTDSNIHLYDIEATLDEDDRGVNFNPPIMPYAGTDSDSDQTDVYATSLTGLIYTTNDFRLDPLVDNHHLILTGSLIARDIRVDGHLQIRQLGELVADPPASLADATPMRFVRGSLRRIPSP